jgi:hypothetical protein
MQAAGLDHALEYAVVQGWDELMPGSTEGVVHIEYQTEADGSLDFLKIWASAIRGHWNLVCELWMRPLWSHTTGLSFGGDYRSGNFSHAVELVIAHADTFSKFPHEQGLIQIYPPTEDERREAERWARAVLDHLAGAKPMEQHVAA